MSWLKHLIHLWRVFTFAIKRYCVDNYSYQASALSFTTLLALVPLFSITVFTLAIFPFFSSLVNTAKKYVFANFIPTSSAIIEQYLESFAEQTKKLPMLQVVFLFVTVILLIALIKNILNTIWYSPKYAKMTSTLIHWAIILSVPIVIVSGISITYFMLSLSWIDRATSFFGINMVIAHLLPLFINMISFSMLYWIVPSCPIRFKDSLIGGLMAAILFELTKIGFILYIEYFPSYEQIYGALAVIPIFLLWIYLSWTIVILGALFTQASGHLRE